MRLFCYRAAGTYAVVVVGKRHYYVLRFGAAARNKWKAGEARNGERT